MAYELRNKKNICFECNKLKDCILCPICEKWMCLPNSELLNNLYNNQIAENGTFTACIEYHILICDKCNDYKCITKHEKYLAMKHNALICQKCNRFYLDSYNEENFEFILQTIYLSQLKLKLSNYAKKINNNTENIKIEQPLPTKRKPTILFQ